MNAVDEKIIEQSKRKLLLYLLGACIFMAVGVWMFSMDDASIEAHRRFNNPLYVHGVGLAAIIMSAPVGALVVRKLFDSKPGVVFNSAGVLDNSSGVSTGFIPWSDITGAEVLQIQRQRMLIVRVVNPEKYLEAGNALKRALNRQSYKSYGSPISITAGTLKISFEELQATFNEYLSKYGKQV
ncbi:MAG: hypothetical protein QOF02_600 [Blastocatellia bacterium]|jgi:hypothetical protein|nr:hypothetical protein [Blastocatellia bacterium]